MGSGGRGANRSGVRGSRHGDDAVRRHEQGRAGPHPNPGKAAVGIRLRRLESDPLTRPIVVRIFEEYASGRGLYAIAEGLTRDGIPCPSAYDRARNPHRSAEAWSKSAVRAILLNPRYTGLSVWGRQRREEVLIDVDDVAAGHRSKMVWTQPSAWVRSSAPAHPALVSPELFERASNRLLASPRDGRRKPRASERPYLLQRLLRCGTCHRRMQGNWNHDEAYYRCRFPAEYALANRIEHPKTIYVREAEIIPRLDEWLALLFEPGQLDETLEMLLAAQGPSAADEARIAAARRTLAECDAKLERYRAAVEAGTDPTIVSRWIREVTELRKQAEREMRVDATIHRSSKEELRVLVEEAGDMVRALAAADPKRKSELYASLGLDLVYDHEERRVIVEADLAVCKDRVGGPKSSNCHPDWRLRPWPPAMETHSSRPVGEDHDFTD